jgi:glutamate-5-semialdehyde dehydrogenase
MDSLRPYVFDAARKAKEASCITARLSSKEKNLVLFEVIRLLDKEKRLLERENTKDLRNAGRKKLAPALIDRLTLTPERIEEMCEGVRGVAGLRDPIGQIQRKWRRPNGLAISKVTVPLGVIFIIYESRPNVTSECASLCLKSGNAVILRGGSEAFYSNRALVQIYWQALKKYSLPEACVSFVKILDHRVVDLFLKLDDWINLVIPRGGEGLIRKVAAQSRIPVIKHYKGVCHLYVDEKANLRKSLSVAMNAKCQRPATCNAMETLLVHQKVAPRFLKDLGPILKKAQCEVRGDNEARKWIPWARPARPSDWGQEFLDKILAVRVVPNLESAIQHIQKFGSAHTDGIMTEDRKTAEHFVEAVDSSSVMVNASTRFSDGFQYGFGAEIGISTDKIHARGPMGLEGLTSYKYVVQGNGQTRE